MKCLKLITVAILFMLTAEGVKAQGLYAQDMNGSPIREKRYTNVNGSPYLTDAWQKAVVELSNGQAYNLDIKYDMVADNIYFKNAAGDSLNFVQPVKQFKISAEDGPHLYRSGFPSTGAKTGERSFYEILYDGTTKLLKKDAKSIWEETTTYGTASRVQNITDHINYFVFKGNQMIAVKPSNKTISGVLSDKATDVDKYIKENKLDLKREQDLKKLFEYYNTL